MVMISELAARQPNSAQGAELVMTIQARTDNGTPNGAAQ